MPAQAQPLAALTSSAAGMQPAGQEFEQGQRKPHLVAPLFEQAMSDLRGRDPERFSVRMREVGYLTNLWIAGGAHEGRRPRPGEALEMVLRTCEAGMQAQVGAGQVKPERALSVLAQTPADLLFRRGFAEAAFATKAAAISAVGTTDLKIVAGDNACEQRLVGRG